MNCTGNSRSVLLRPILFKPTAFRLLQPQLEQSSEVLGTTGRFLCQYVAFAGYRSPLLSQAMQLPSQYYTAPGFVSRAIMKHISPPPALLQQPLVLPRCQYAVPWRGQFLRIIFLHNIKPTVLTGASLLPRRFYTTKLLSENLNSIQKFLFRGIFLPRRSFSTPLERGILQPIRHTNRVLLLRQSWQCRMASTRSVIHCARSYFGCFWKVILAAAFINIMWSFVYHTFIVQVPYTSHTRFFHLETVPYTNRTHLVVRSPIDDHKYGESCFSYIKKNHSSKFLSPLHTDSVRVNRITTKLVPAVQRGLAIKRNDPAKHLDGLIWEAIVLKDDGHVGAMSLSNGKILVFTGLLNNLETDAEIATIIAHEIAHVVARHWSESIIYEKWFPYPLKVYFLRRNELEADHIGMLILAAAGFDPHIAPVAVEKLVGNDIFHPSGKKRAQLLSRPRCMDEAMELYREVIAAKAP